MLSSVFRYNIPNDHLNEFPYMAFRMLCCIPSYTCLPPEPVGRTEKNRFDKTKNRKNIFLAGWFLKE